MSSLLHVRARLSRTRLRAPLAWVRNLGLDSSDVFLASYPRSGNTMLRFMLGEALSGIPSSFDNIQRTIPEIGVHVHACALLANGGRLIKTHEPYCHKYKRAIYIYRDVRDVMVSCFERELALDMLHIHSLDGYVRPFMLGKMTRFGSWQAHLESWLDGPLAQSGDLLVVRFEDLRKDPAGTVARCLDFLGKRLGADAIARAVANNSLERMREKEDGSQRLPKSPRELGRWVGTGKISGWRGRLAENQLKVVNEYGGRVLARVGYPTAAEVDATLAGAQNTAN